MNACQVVKWTSRVGWPVLLALIAVNPQPPSPWRLVFILLTVVVPLAWALHVLPVVMADYFAAIKLGMLLHAREVGEPSPGPQEPTRAPLRLLG